MDNPNLTAMMRLHSNLPRQGPGSDLCTKDAFGRLPNLKLDARVLDLGCGPGRSTMVLAEMGYKILALDSQTCFLEQLKSSAKARGLDHLIDTVQGDMAEPPVQAGSIDLIWSEGAIYCIGFDRGLTLWRNLLSTSSGFIACTELSWLTAERPYEAISFWSENYPEMRSVEQNISAAQNLGYACIDHFTLPQSAWFNEYYAQLESNMATLGEDSQDMSLSRAIQNMRLEIDTYRKYNSCYGYEFYLLRKA